MCFAVKENVAQEGVSGGWNQGSRGRDAEKRRVLIRSGKEINLLEKIAY